jgi:hypothetical protein
MLSLHKTLNRSSGEDYHKKTANLLLSKQRTMAFQTTRVCHEEA